MIPPRLARFLERVGPLYIGGAFEEAAGGERIEVLDPSTAEPIAQVARGGPEDAARAVRAARRALEGAWGRTSPDERGRLLFRLAEAIEAHAEELAALEALNVGKPIGEARMADVPLAAQHFRYFAGWPTKLTGEVLPVSLPGRHHVFTRREPVGVVAAITPWNFPLLIASWKLAPALAAGNAVVLKPSELTPLSALYLAELVEEVGFPAGAVNVVPGRGEDVGRALVADPGVDKVSFTGSVEVGQAILRQAAETMKRVTLELGGKSPNIVFEDADLERALKGSLFAAFFNQGEICAAGSRLFVPRKAAAEITERLVEEAKRIRLGPALAPGTQMGPLVSRSHLERVRAYIELGQKEGAELLVGGGPAPEAGPGFFLRPTIFRAEDRHAISREEVFGPVLAVLAFDDLEEVVGRADDTPYGLAAGIWTRDLSRALRVAEALRAGTVWVNGYYLLDAAGAWGGFRASGLGREMGRYALEHYTEVKTVWLNLG